MKVRTLAGALLAAPALLVAMATNGNAASTQGAVAFAGRITIVPNATGAPGSSQICFDGLAGCLDSTGAAAGTVLAKPVTGMHGTFDYRESCTVAAPYAATGTANLNAELKDALGSTPVAAKWQRYGLVAVITNANPGEVVAGAAVVAPAPKAGTVPLCGAPIDLVVTGAMAFA